MERKLRIGIVFGGRSGEHEVSVASARSIMAAIDRSRYEVVPVAIARSGQWLAGVGPQALAAPNEALAVTEDASPAAEAGTAIEIAGFARLPQVQSSGATGLGDIDVIFPVLHGTYGEDGALQGMLEMAGLPYVGCGVLGSALGMDKEKAKLLFQAAGLPTVPGIIVFRAEVERDPEAVIMQIAERFGYPVFVKPANLGSSVGVSKAHEADELRGALALAARYDRKLVVEQAIDCREIECAVLGNDDPQASVVGEIVPSKEFYDYEAKYLDGASRLIIPAPIPDETAEAIRRMAVTAFRALDLSGLARVDFFLDRATGRVYLNEVNTMPGFTEISMYPKLWEASGLPYPQLISRLIELAIERHADRQRNEIGLHGI
jgi:D-alanine-D-alanine ligase